MTVFETLGLIIVLPLAIIALFITIGLIAEIVRSAVRALRKERDDK